MKLGAESHLELVLVTHDFEGVKKSEVNMKKAKIFHI